MSAAPALRRLRRRVYLPIATALLLTASLAVAIVRSDTSQIILFNETGRDLGPLTLHACGQIARFALVEDQGSVRMRLENQGPESSVELFGPSSEGWRWEGAYMENHGGYVVTLHIRDGVDIEAHTQLSIWQRLLFDRKSVGE